MFSVCDTKITGEVWVYWSLSTWRGFMCLTQICGCSRLSNHWSIRCPCFCFGSACGVWLWTRLLCLHIQHQRQWELPAGKRAFGMLSSAELFSRAAEKRSTWTMLFLAVTAPLLAARGLKLYLWFRLQAGVKTPEKGGPRWKRFKSWENCLVFSSADNLFKHLSSVES